MLSAFSAPITSKKRSIQDIFSGDAEGDEADHPKKKKLSRFVAEAADDEPTPIPSATESQDVQQLVVSTMKQIEERRKQTQALLAQQGLAMPLQPQQPMPALFGQQGLGGMQQSPLLKTPFQQRNTSVHPLAYTREKHIALGMTMGPSALDKAVKAAEVRNILLY